MTVLTAPKRYVFFPYDLLLVAVVAAYANGWQGEFLYDDTYEVVHNSLLKSWHTLPQLLGGVSYSGVQQQFGFRRPLMMLLFFALYHIFGLTPVPFHLADIGLHALDANLLYRVGRRLGLGRGAALAGTLLWAVHPLHVEAVDYISGIEDPLYTAFIFGGLLALMARPTRMMWPLVFFALALASKESAVAFPALATVALYWQGGEAARRDARRYLRLWPLWLVALLYTASYLLLTRIQFYDPANSLYAATYADHIANRLWTALATLPVYLRLIVWPDILHDDRTFPVFTSPLAPLVLGGVGLTAMPLILLIAGRFMRRRRLFVPLACGIAWFGIALLPSTGIARATDELICEHWMYLPLAGLALGLAATLAEIPARWPVLRPACIVVVGIAALALGVRTSLQSGVWHDTRAFYQNIFDSGALAGHAHNDLGIYDCEQGDFDDAVTQFKLAIASPAPMPASLLPDLYVNLAKAYIGVRPDSNDTIMPQAFAVAVQFSPHVPEAIDALEAALRLDPDAYWPNQLLAAIYGQTGEAAKAAYYEREAQAALRHAP